jgi:hypothetical protein
MLEEGNQHIFGWGKNINRRIRRETFTLGGVNTVGEGAASRKFL